MDSPLSESIYVKAESIRAATMYILNSVHFERETRDRTASDHRTGIENQANGAVCGIPEMITLLN